MNSNLYCPDCNVELWWMSTTNEWEFKCPKCRHRFNQKLERMPPVD